MYNNESEKYSIYEKLMDYIVPFIIVPGDIISF
jgi:hypothetical protein